MRIVSQTELQVSSTDQKLSDITAAVEKWLQTLCEECAPEMIDNQFFVCYPESPSHVTYRARLEGTSERGSDSLISLIEDWVRGGPSVIVTGVLMTVDSLCSVAISSLSEGECLPHDPSTEPRATDRTTKYGSPQGSTNNTAGIIGGTFATVLIIVVALTIIAIAALILKNRRAGEKLVQSLHATLSSTLSLSLSNPPTHTQTHTLTCSHSHTKQNTLSVQT